VRRRAHRKPQDLSAIRLEQDILHAEARRAQPDRDQQPGWPPAMAELAPGFGEWRSSRSDRCAGRIARLLLPEREQIERHGQQRRALNHLDQAELRELCEERAEHERAPDHSDQQHDVQERNDPGSRMLGRDVGGECETGRLRGVHAGPDQQECERGSDMTDPLGPMRIAREHQQREGHDREAAELCERAHPDVRDAPPTDCRAMRVGSVAEERPERRKHERQRDHQRDEPRRHAELDDHHAVQRAGEQHGRHAHGYLKQGEAQQASERQLGRRGVRERQKPRADQEPCTCERVLHPDHSFTSSIACEM
jgi:hypothetical protein